MRAKFYPGEIFDHLIKLREKTGENIIDIVDAHKQNNGTLAGAAKIRGTHDKYYHLPFKGEELIRKIAGEDIKDSVCIRSCPDGALTGAVLIGKRWLLFKENILIESIAGKSISYVVDIYPLTESMLAGVVKIEGRNLPFVGERLIESIAGKNIGEVVSIYPPTDGILAGVVKIEGRNLPFVGETLIEIAEDVEKVWYFHSQPDGTLVGLVELIKGRLCHFIWNKYRGSGVVFEE